MLTLGVNALVAASIVVVAIALLAYGRGYSDGIKYQCRHRRSN